MKKTLSGLALLLTAFVAISAMSIPSAFAWGRLEKSLIAGSTSVPIYTYQEWTFTITIEALPGYNIYDVVVKDKLPAEINIVSVTYAIGTVTWGKVGNGKAGATDITWNVGDLMAGESATLTVTVCTRTSPNGKHVGFTSEGTYYLNYGATATYFNGEATETLTTNPIEVVAHA